MATCLRLPMKRSSLTGIRLLPTPFLPPIYPQALVGSEMGFFDSARQPDDAEKKKAKAKAAF